MSPAEDLRFLGSELRLVFGRRRNQAGVAVLAAVPVLITLATKLSNPDRGRGGGPSFFDQIVQNGLFVALAALTVEIGLFLPMAVAMLSADAVAGEAHQGTLRYLLTVPVSRTRLLVIKYVAVVIGGFVGVFLVALVGVVVGSVVFGTGPMTTLAGSQISFGTALGRILVAVLYVSAAMAALGAVGLFASTLTEQPIAAVVAVMVFAAGSWIADSIPALAGLHPWLLVHHWPDFADLFRDPPYWTGIRTGLLVDAAYAVIGLLAAWARLHSKDVTS